MRITLLKIFIQILILLAVSGCIIPQSWLVNDPIDDHFHPGINVDTQVDHFSPVANNDAATIDFETPTIINVVANDTDPQSSTFTVVSNTAATSGALVDNGDGTITYTPNANFSGTDSFTYTIQNSFGLNATATVNLTVLSYCATFTQIAVVPFTGAPKAYAPLPDGTVPKPYLLCTKAQLDAIAADNTLWDTENYKLMQDIDMDNGGVNNGIIGTTANNFTGVFDGNNFTLSNFRFQNPASTEVGFFGVVGAAGSVKNATVTTGAYSIDGDDNVGIFIGQILAGAGVISNIHSTGTIQTTGGASISVGGLIGYSDSDITLTSATVTITSNAGTDQREGGLIGCLGNNATLSNSTSAGTINGRVYVGGLVGLVVAGNVTNSSSTAAIVPVTSAAGGLIGEITTGTLDGGYYSGGVVTANNLYTGGLVGTNNGTIQNSQFAASATINSNGGITGGCAGRNLGAAIINNCTVAGDIIMAAGFSSIGGIVGTNSATVSSSTFTGSVTANTTNQLGGIVGSNSGQIESSTFNGYLSGTGSSWGGIAGQNIGAGNILNTNVASGTITSTNPNQLGGITGYNDAIIQAGTHATVNFIILGAGGTVGGLVGRNLVGRTLTNCYVTGGYMSIEGANNVGGLVGQNDGTINTSYSSVNINLTGNGSDTVGGFVGVNTNIISSSFSLGNLTGDGFRNVGGFAGSMSSNGPCTNCWTMSDVENDSTAAGAFLGLLRNTGAVITNSYSFGSYYSISIGGQGGFVGNQDGGTISDSFTFSNLFINKASSGGVVGGFVGSLDSSVVGTIVRSRAYGNIRSAGSFPLGGFIGAYGDDGTGTGNVNSCFAMGNITSFGNTDQVGGFVGRLLNGSILNSYASGSVYGSDSYVGGFVGESAGAGGGELIQNSYSTGNVTGNTQVGGFQGRGTGAGEVFTNNYSTGTVTATTAFLGGFFNSSASVYNNNFWDSTIPGGLSSSDAGAVDGIIADTTASLTNEQTFTDVGWDFAAVWTMPQGVAVGASGPPRNRGTYFCDAVNAAAVPYAGAGTYANPFVICDAVQYNALVGRPADWGSYIILGDNIDFGAAAIGVIGTLANPFSGTFDGRGHTLSNFSINQGGSDNVGVFGYVAGDGNGDLTGDGYIWALKINANNIIGDNNVGTIVGNLQTGKVIYTQVLGTNVTGISNVGGAIGNVEKNFFQLDANGAISDHGSLLNRVYITGTVVGTGSNVGGLVGRNNGKIMISYAKANVNSPAATEVGGGVGLNASEVINSYAETNQVVGASVAGGYVGSNTGTIERAYSAGTIPGFAGSNSATVTDCFYDNTLATSASAGGSGLTTAQMQDSSNFTNWSFNLHWLAPGGAYLDLLWEQN